MITKILSVSDVITNSSSEVFVMTEENARYYDNLGGTDGCITIDCISWDWILREEEYELVCDVCNLNKSEVLKPGQWWPEREDWEAFCEKHREKIEKDLIGYYFVDIEDHFEGACEVSEDARHSSIWSDYRH